MYNIYIYSLTITYAQYTKYWANQSRITNLLAYKLTFNGKLFAKFLICQTEQLKYHITSLGYVIVVRKYGIRQHEKVHRNIMSLQIILLSETLTWTPVCE